MSNEERIKTLNELKSKLLAKKFTFAIGKSTGIAPTGDLLSTCCFEIKVPGAKSIEKEKVKEKVKVKGVSKNGCSFNCEVFGKYDSIEQVGELYEINLRVSQINFELNYLQNPDY